MAPFFVFPLKAQTHAIKSPLSSPVSTLIPNFPWSSLSPDHPRFYSFTIKFLIKNIFSPKISKANAWPEFFMQNKNSIGPLSFWSGLRVMVVRLAHRKNAIQFCERIQGWISYPAKWNRSSWNSQGVTLAGGVREGGGECVLRFCTTITLSHHAVPFSCLWFDYEI